MFIERKLLTYSTKKKRKEEKKKPLLNKTHRKGKISYEYGYIFLMRPKLFCMMRIVDKMFVVLRCRLHTQNNHVYQNILENIMLFYSRKKKCQYNIPTSRTTTHKPKGYRVVHITQIKIIGYSTESCDPNPTFGETPRKT